MAKRILCIVTTLVFVLVLGGCSNSKSTSNYKVPKYGIQKEEEFRVVYVDVLDNLDNLDNKEFPVGTDVTFDVGSSIDYYGDKIVDFVNENYDLHWIYEPIQVISGDFSNTDYYSYNAFYIPNSGIMYINESPSITINKEEIQYIYVHELIHYLRDINIGTCDFLYSEHDGLGKYTMETLTDLLTIKIFGTEEAEEFFLTKSGYSYSVVGMEILELAIPDLIEYYLKNDMKGLENQYNSISEKYVDMTEVDIENPFMNFLYVVDANQIAYNNLVLAVSMSDNERIQKYFRYQTKYWIGEYELAVLLCRGLDESKKLQAISFYEKMFELEVGNDVDYIQEASEYLKSCLS